MKEENRKCGDTIWEWIGRMSFTRYGSAIQKAKSSRDEGRCRVRRAWASLGVGSMSVKAKGSSCGRRSRSPTGRIVDFLLDHGVVVYPVNPKALDRARDRFRMSQSKSDSFDAYVLAEFLRTDHVHLRALEPDSEQAQELKMLTRDHHRLGRHKTRLLNQIEVTLKEYYPRPLEVFSDLESQIALDFLKQYPTPRALSKLTRQAAGTTLPSATIISARRAVKSCGRRSISLS